MSMSSTLLPSRLTLSIDRSNGFEKKFFQNQNAKKRRGLESYQWSAEDM